MGYHRAGFDEIVGVDIAPQPRYPFEFVQADALEFLADHGHEFDAIHASPPCQGYSIMHNLPWLRGRDYPLLMLPTIEMLEGLGKPYVVENVMGARHGSKTLKKRGLEAHGLKAGWLCGTMFGLPFYRHRLFATNWLWLAPGHPKHVGVIRPGPMFGNNGGRLAKVVFPDGTKQNKGRGALLAYQGNSAWRQYHDGALNIRPGYEKVPFSYPTIVGERLRANGRKKEKIGLSNGMPETQLTNWQNGAQGGRRRHRPRKGLAVGSRGNGHRLDEARRDDPGHPASLHGIHRAATAPDSRG